MLLDKNESGMISGAMPKPFGRKVVKDGFELDDESDIDEGIIPEDENLGFDNLNDFSSPAPIEKHPDLLKNLTNFDPFIKSKINGWLGLVWNDESGKYEENPLIEPMMNAKCASWCVEFIKVYARNNNIITDIGRSSYEHIVGDIIEVVWYNLGTRMEEFDINDNGDAFKICVELQHIAELVLMGAGDGRYNKFLGTVTSRTENVSMNPQAGFQQQYPMQQQMGNDGHRQQKGFFKNMTRKLFGG